jgi:hypothetical protein
METGKIESESAEPEGHRHDATPRRSSRWRVTILLVALVLVGGGLLGYQLQLFDAYRPGTTHEVHLERVPDCMNPPDLNLDGRIWVQSESTSASWATYPAGTFVSGTLEVTERDRGVLHFDSGQDIAYRRLPAGFFSSMTCSAR